MIPGKQAINSSVRNHTTARDPVHTFQQAWQLMPLPQNGVENRGEVVLILQAIPQFAAEVETQHQSRSVPQLKLLLSHHLLKATSCSFSSTQAGILRDVLPTHHPCTQQWTHRPQQSQHQVREQNSATDTKTPLAAHLHLSFPICKEKLFSCCGSTFTTDMVVKRGNENSKDKADSPKLSTFCDNQGKQQELNKEQRTPKVLFCQSSSINKRTVTVGSVM